MDLDDLLAEVDGVLKGDPIVKPTATSKSTSKYEILSDINSNTGNVSVPDDLDDLINMTSVVSPPHKESKSISSYAPSSNYLGSSKCITTILGGSSFQLGKYSAISNSICDNLRCSSCDFKVNRYIDKNWTSSVNYLFFRNNFPDYDKLKCNLRPCKGGAAYACQCSWYNVKESDKPINIPSELKWHCGGH